MDKQSLTRLFNYHYSANHRLWHSVMALSEKEFTQALSDGSPPIRTQLVRMVATENLWVNYLWHDEVEFLQESQFPTRASIRAEWDALEEEMRDFIDELSPAELESQVGPAFLHTSVSLKVWEVLLQILNHATECRVHMRLHLQRVSGDVSIPTERAAGIGVPALIRDGTLSHLFMHTSGLSFADLQHRKE